MEGMYSFLKIVAIIVPILVVCTMVFTIAMIASPKLRGKMMARQIKSAKYMLDESKSDLESMGTTAGNLGVNIKKNIMDANEDTLKDLSIREANISKEKIRITAKAIKDGLVDDKIYCKHCGAGIDKDSKFCSQCGKEQ